MFDWLRSVILSITMVPPEPHPPEGSAASVRIFRAGRNYYRLRILGWAFGSLWSAIVLGAAGMALEMAASRRFPPWGQSLWHTIAAIGLILFLASVVWAFVQQQLNYELRWYIVTDRSLRVRHGIISTHELTTTFANIQEIRVSAGPLQKLLGLADLEIQSAGGGGGGGPHSSSSAHVARFSGLDNANEIRDYVVNCLRQYRDSGLGEADHSPSPEASSALAAAHTVLEEARGLRAALGKS
ncbi:MAG: PH domain-containing protein [Bryobacteraceae bacterium]